MAYMNTRGLSFIIGWQRIQGVEQKQMPWQAQRKRK